MSVVVAIKEKDRVLVGVDSQATKGGTRTSLSNPNNYKVWKVNDVENCLMAHVGYYRDAMFIKTMSDLVDELAVVRDSIDYRYVVRRILPRILDELIEFKCLKNEDDVENLLSSFIFAYKDKLFLILSDRSVLEIDDYCAIGSGASEALGSLLSTEELKSEERIVKAITSSATHDIYVDYPIIISDTMTTEFKVISERQEGKKK